MNAASASFLLDRRPMSHPMEMPREVAVVGAGRWGRIVAELLGRDFPGIARIRLVAERNASETRAWLADGLAGPERAEALRRLEVVEAFDTVLGDPAVTAMFVTKGASEHHSAVKRALAAGKHVLVEKPFVLQAAQARELVEQAQRAGRVLMVGHEYLFAPDFYRMRDLVARCLGSKDRRVECVWEGAAAGAVGGQADWSSNAITDLLPHVLSQLLVVLGRAPQRVDAVRSADRLWQAEVELRHGTVPVAVVLDKRAARPRRRLRIHDADGTQLELDYTQEPGMLHLNGAEPPAETERGQPPRPLTGEIRHFFFAIAGQAGEGPPAMGADAIAIVETTEEADRRLRALQASALRDALHAALPTAIPPDLAAILRHHLATPLSREGLVRNPRDAAEVDGWAWAAMTVIHALANRPWTTQEEVARLTGLDRDALLRLNAALRSVDLLQALIVQHGPGQKYWSSYLPLIRSGAVQAAIDEAYAFPLRIGIFPGLSCMLHCTFCGRQGDARYLRELVDSGNELFRRVFQSSPVGGPNKFAIGGGLEPLTNPRIDDVIRAARQYAHAIPMISNGYMLTPAYVARHPGLWDLDSLRISLYGIDEASYARTTRVASAFPLIKRNLIEFLRTRNVQAPGLKVGLNYVVLREMTDNLSALLDLIIDLGRQAGGGPGIDFLTLREDFSVSNAERFSREERDNLMAIFERFAERRRRECPHLHVDFGFGLFALTEGLLGTGLVRATEEEMRPKAFPQVSVAIDLHGDVYVYHEAAFPERPGATRYRIGTLGPQRELEQVVREFLDAPGGIAAQPGDACYLDAFDHAAIKLVNQADADRRFGIPFAQGPVAARARADASAISIPTILNAWYADTRVEERSAE